MKRVDVVVKAECGESTRLQITRTSGRLSHYFHFLQDFAWPLFDWLRHEESRARRPVASVGISDPGACEFDRVFRDIFGFPLFKVGIGDRLKSRFDRLRSRTVLHGYNSRFRDYMKTFEHGGSLQASADAFRQHVESRLSVPVLRAEERSVVLIERAPGAVDRGSARRSIVNHGHLRAHVENYCSARSVRFENVQMEHLSFEQQFALCRNAAVLIGQHGAGLANTIWLTPGQTAVLELAGARSPMHYSHLAADVGLDYARLVFPSERSREHGERLEVETQAVIALLNARLADGRNMADAVPSQGSDSGLRNTEPIHFPKTLTG